MMTSSFRAMGTEIEAWCELPSQEQTLRMLFEEIEQLCSRFRPRSELSVINSAPGPTHRLSSGLAPVIAAAARARELTGGLVDIGVGAVVRDWGYDRTFAEIVDLADTPTPPSASEWSLAGDVLARAPGTTFDLGGIAKGWTCDLAVDRGLCLVASAGGDLRSAHEGTIVSVVDPWEETAARVRVGVGALATSSVSRRRWRVGGREVSHLIDPRTRAPVETPVLSATVVAGTAVEAEAGAKAVLLLGEDGLAWADAQDWISAALAVWHDGSVYATSGVDLAA